MLRWSVCNFNQFHNSIISHIYWNKKAGGIEIDIAEMFCDVLRLFCVLRKYVFEYWVESKYLLLHMPVVDIVVVFFLMLTFFLLFLMLIPLLAELENNKKNSNVAQYFVHILVSFPGPNVTTLQFCNTEAKRCFATHDEEIDLQTA